VLLLNNLKLRLIKKNTMIRPLRLFSVLELLLSVHGAARIDEALRAIREE